MRKVLLTVALIVLGSKLLASDHFILMTSVQPLSGQKFGYVQVVLNTPDGPMTCGAEDDVKVMNHLRAQSGKKLTVDIGVAK